MADLEAVRAKLKKTTVVDRSEPNLQEAIRQQKQEAETFSKMCEVNMERWYSTLQEHTFKSQWILVTKELAHALIAGYERFLSKKGILPNLTF